MEATKALESALTKEEAFQALPPLDSDEYVEHILIANTEDLPPEILARAYRQVPPHSAASDETLRRLTRRHGERWEYFGPLVARARRLTNSHDEYEDLLQDAFRRIFETLPTARGQYAEKAWFGFCYRELIDAWRERHGRRGERLKKEVAMGESEDDATRELLSLVSELPPWHEEVRVKYTEKIEDVMHRVLEEIPDRFVRAVAGAAWLGNERPRVSGTTAKKDNLSLTEHFPGKSRFQITRALRQADSQLAAALLTELDVELNQEVRALLERKSH
jgi:DNA-directed RNA polymerase specialized sigma24 family protein